jgi:hypothetical protein
MKNSCVSLQDVYISLLTFYNRFRSIEWCILGGKATMLKYGIGMGF